VQDKLNSARKFLQANVKRQTFCNVTYRIASYRIVSYSVQFRSLHCAWVVQTTQNVLWPRASVCLSVCACPRPYANTIARTRM